MPASSQRSCCRPLAVGAQRSRSVIGRFGGPHARSAAMIGQSVVSTAASTVPNWHLWTARLCCASQSPSRSIGHSQPHVVRCLTGRRQQSEPPRQVPAGRWSWADSAEWSWADPAEWPWYAKAGTRSDRPRVPGGRPKRAAGRCGVPGTLSRAALAAWPLRSAPRCAWRVTTGLSVRRHLNVSAHASWDVSVRAAWPRRAASLPVSPADIW